MKEGIHPNYREVLFSDLSNGFKFVTRSCVNTKETETFEGKEYPLFKLDTSSESHPFYTGTQKSVDNMVAASSASVTASARPQPNKPLRHRRGLAPKAARVIPCCLFCFSVALQ